MDLLGSSLSNTAHEMSVCKRVAEKLNDHYPGHLWGVNMVQGVIQVMNLGLSARWGFQIKEENLDPDYKKVLMAGGELLERYNIKRGRMDVDQMNSLQRDLRGEAINVDKT